MTLFSLFIYVVETSGLPKVSHSLVMECITMVGLTISHLTGWHESWCYRNLCRRTNIRISKLLVLLVLFYGLEKRVDAFGTSAFAGLWGIAGLTQCRKSEYLIKVNKGLLLA